MEQTEDKKMITEMKSFLAEKAKTNHGSDDPKAEENLPFESIDSYSTDPVGFGEMSLRMLSKVEFVFDLAVKENRFSSKYLKRCIQLEKGIKYLGSLCVTKYALQTQGQTFPQLGQLSTEKLYCMTSHHFRKLDQAVTEYMFEHRDVPDKLFDMEMHYFNLLERLRSTETKIKKFHESYIFGETNDAPIIHGFAFSEKSRTRSIHRQYDEAPAFRHAPAFGLLAEAHGGEAPAPNQSGEACTSRNRQSLPHVAAKSAHGAVTCDASLPAEQVSGVSGQGSEVTAAPDLEGVPRRRGLTPSVTGLSNPVPEDAKNQVSGISDQGSENEEALVSASRPSSCQRGQLSKAGSHGKVAEELHKNNKKEENLPPSLEIMKRVMERSRESDDNSLTFTIDEMEFLARDPLFARLDPRLANDLRKILEAGPPG